MSYQEDFYSILEIEKTANISDITKAYRKKALIHHPDKGGDIETFKKINQAYESLCEINRKEPVNPLANIWNFFSSPKKTQPYYLPLKISLESLCKREIIKLKVSRDRVCPCFDLKKQRAICACCAGTGGITVPPFILTCPVCKGAKTIPLPSSGKGGGNHKCEHPETCKQGIYQDEKFFVLHLNPELEDGYNYFFQNEGNQEVGCEIGDFIVQIRYNSHPIFSLCNKDLILTKNFTLKESLCGTNFKVTHPNGEEIDIKISDVIYPERSILIKNKGLTEQGDLVIKSKIIFPDIIQNELKEKLLEIL